MCALPPELDTKVLEPSDELLLISVPVAMLPCLALCQHGRCSPESLMKGTESIGLFNLSEPDLGSLLSTFAKPGSSTVSEVEPWIPEREDPQSGCK